MYGGLYCLWAVSHYIRQVKPVCLFICPVFVYELPLLLLQNMTWEICQANAGPAQKHLQKEIKKIISEPPQVVL